MVGTTQCSRNDSSQIGLEKKPQIVLANPKFVEHPIELRPDEVEFEKPPKQP